MKVTDLKAGTTYVGKNGRRRHIQEFRRYQRDDVIYDVPDGGVRCCSRATFARWAEREANPDEAAP